MIIKDINNPEIELVSFDLKYDDDKLHGKYLKWLKDKNITAFLGSGIIKGIENRSKFIEDSFKRFTQDNCIGFFIRYVPDDVFIGSAKIDNISKHTRSASDGIMIGDQKYQGKGIAIMVYKILLSYAFDRLKLHRVGGGCNEYNIPMIKTFERVGYSLEGRFIDADFINGKFSDHLYFGILNKKFKKISNVSLSIV